MANLNLLNIFLTVADQKNITKASEILYISQPAISSSIKKLESELGGKLFIRKNKGVELTNEGQAIYNMIKSSLNKIDNVYSYFNRVNQIQKGTLRIGTSTSNINQYLNESISNFINEYPDINIKVIRDIEKNLISKLQNNELDLIVLDSEYLAADLDIVKTFEVNYSIIGNEKYYNKYNNRPMDILTFANEDLVLINNSKTSRQNFDSYFSKFNITLNPKYELENYQLIINLIEQGKGVGIVNLEYFKKEIKNKKIFQIQTTFNLDKRFIVLATSSKHYYNPAKDTFVEMVKKNK